LAKDRDHGWRIRTDDELRALYRKRNIVTTIKARRLEWAGHLLRVSDDRTVKKVFLGKPDGRKKVVRPKLRWRHCTENGLKFMRVKRWRKKAKTDSYGLSFWRRYRLNCKDLMQKKKKKKNQKNRRRRKKHKKKRRRKKNKQKKRKKKRERKKRKRRRRRSRRRRGGGRRTRRIGGGGRRINRRGGGGRRRRRRGEEEGGGEEEEKEEEEPE
jgi:hypothetical protein